MRDIEKIKQALICQKNVVGKLIECGDCPYRDSRDCLTEVTNDVIELLDEQAERIAIMVESNALRCFHCGYGQLLWDSDEVIEEDEAVIHHLHCPECNARVEYHIGT